MVDLVNFPVRMKSIQLVDSGSTKVFLVAFNPSLAGSVFLNLEGTFSGDDTTDRQALSTRDLDLDQIVEALRKQDRYDSYYYPYLGTKHHQQSIPFKAVSQIGTFDKTLEYLMDIYPWTCSYHNLTEEGQKMYLNWKEWYPNCLIRILTMANI